MRSVVLFRREGEPSVASILWTNAASYLRFRRSEGKLNPEYERIGVGPAAYWQPASLQILSAFPRLQRLEILPNASAYPEVQSQTFNDLHGETSKSDPIHVRHMCDTSQYLEGLYVKFGMPSSKVFQQL